MRPAHSKVPKRFCPIVLKVKGRSVYLYRAIDRDGNLVDVLLSEKRDKAAAEAFFRSARIVTGSVPERVTTDGHDAYSGAIKTALGDGVLIGRTVT